MNYNVIPTPDFIKFFKKLLKKYPSLKNDLAQLIEKIERDYQIGTSLGNNLYKIRLAIESKNKGKSAGARLIYFFLADNNEVYLIHIFDKSQFDNIPKHILLDLLKNASLC